MTKLATRPTDIGIVLPVALTQLYFESLELWPAGQAHGIAYSCAFEDNPAKIEKLAPDVQVSLTDAQACNEVSGYNRIYVKRLVVASPGLLDEFNIIDPLDLKDLPYATLSRQDTKRFTLMASNGKSLGITPKRCFEGNDLFAAYEAAKQGIAFAILPEWMVIEDIKLGSLIALCPSWEPEYKRVKVTISDRCVNRVKAKILAGLMVEKMKIIPGITVLP